MPYGTLEIHHVDVGQGEATLIVYTAQDGTTKRVYLIDGGRTTRGGETVERYMTSLGLAKIDVAIVTHYDADHIEGVAYLVTQGLVGEVRHHNNETSQTGQSSSKWELLDKAVKNTSTTIGAFRDGDVITINHGLITPQPNVGDPAEPPLTLECVSVNMATGFEENDNSIAMLLTYGNFKYYTGGDLESIVEDDLTSTIAPAGSHVCAIKCGHHGSKHSTSVEFLADTQAHVAFISAGKHSYCHPDQDVIDRLIASAHIQQFYMTNCHYNRHGVNPNYNANRPAERAALVTALQERVNVGKMTPEDMQKKLDDFDAETAGRQGPPAAWKGSVGGSANHLGTFSLGMTGQDAQSAEHPFAVGTHDGDNWQWITHECGRGMDDAATVLHYARPDLGNHSTIATLQGVLADTNDAWLTEINKEHTVAPFSLPTKVAGETKIVEPLSDNEYDYAMGADLSDDDDDSDDDEDFDDPGGRKRKRDPSESGSDTEEDSRKKRARGDSKPAIGHLSLGRKRKTKFSSSSSSSSSYSSKRL